MALGCFFLQKAVRRGAARSWGWERSGDVAPLSRPSYAVWGITFLVIGAVLVGVQEAKPLSLAGSLLALNPGASAAAACWQPPSSQDVRRREAYAVGGVPGGRSILCTSPRCLVSSPIRRRAYSSSWMERPSESVSSSW